MQKDQKRDSALINQRNNCLNLQINQQDSSFSFQIQKNLNDSSHLKSYDELHRYTQIQEERNNPQVKQQQKQSKQQLQNSKSVQNNKKNARNFQQGQANQSQIKAVYIGQSNKTMTPNNQNQSKESQCLKYSRYIDNQNKINQQSAISNRFIILNQQIHYSDNSRIGPSIYSNFLSQQFLIYANSDEKLEYSLKINGSISSVKAKEKNYSQSKQRHYSQSKQWSQSQIKQNDRQIPRILQRQCLKKSIDQLSRLLQQKINFRKNYKHSQATKLNRNNKLIKNYTDNNINFDVDYHSHDFSGSLFEEQSKFLEKVEFLRELKIQDGQILQRLQRLNILNFEQSSLQQLQLNSDMYFLNLSHANFEISKLLIFDWSEIEVLDLRDCQLTDSDWITFALFSNRFINLKMIYLEENEIHRIKISQLTSFVNLKHIIVNGSSLELQSLITIVNSEDIRSERMKRRNKFNKSHKHFNCQDQQRQNRKNYDEIKLNFILCPKNDPNIYNMSINQSLNDLRSIFKSNSRSVSFSNSVKNSNKQKQLYFPKKEKLHFIKQQKHQNYSSLAIQQHQNLYPERQYFQNNFKFNSNLIQSRKKVGNQFLKKPFNSVGRVLVGFPFRQAKQYANIPFGTGVIIGQRVVLTVAHVLYIAKQNNSAINVFFQITTKHKTKSLIKVIKYSIHRQYFNKQNKKSQPNDLALLILQENNLIEDSMISNLSRNNNLSELSSSLIICGYPSIQKQMYKQIEGFAYEQYFEYGPVVKIKKGFIFYKHLTGPGNSGSPIFIKISDQTYELVGIHKGALANHNFGILLSQVSLQFKNIIWNFNKKSQIQILDQIQKHMTSYQTIENFSKSQDLNKMRIEDKERNSHENSHKIYELQKYIRKLISIEQEPSQCIKDSQLLWFQCMQHPVQKLFLIQNVYSLKFDSILHQIKQSLQILPKHNLFVDKYTWNYLLQKFTRLWLNYREKELILNLILRLLQRNASRLSSRQEYKEISKISDQFYEIYQIALFTIKERKQNFSELLVNVKKQNQLSILTSEIKQKINQNAQKFLNNAKYANSYVNELIFYYKQRQFATVFQKLKHPIVLHMKNLDIYFGKAEIFKEMGYIKRSLIQCQKCIAYQKQASTQNLIQINPLTLKAKLYEQLNQLPQAIQCYKQIFNLFRQEIEINNPICAQIIKQISFLNLKLNNIDAGIGYYKLSNSILEKFESKSPEQIKRLTDYLSKYQFYNMNAQTSELQKIVYLKCFQSNQLHKQLSQEVLLRLLKLTKEDESCCELDNKKKRKCEKTKTQKKPEITNIQMGKKKSNTIKRRRSIL